MIIFIYVSANKLWAEWWSGKNFPLTLSTPRVLIFMLECILFSVVFNLCPSTCCTSMLFLCDCAARAVENVLIQSCFKASTAVILLQACTVSSDFTRFLQELDIFLQHDVCKLYWPLTAAKSIFSLCSCQNGG